jgi:hypothetical protein
MAWLTNSGPLSDRMNSAAPWMLSSRESTSTTRREQMFVQGSVGDVPTYPTSYFYPDVIDAFILPG